MTPIDYAIFQDHGYMGLYGGLGAKDIHRRKGLKKSQQILDHMGSTELAANLFRATQTEEKLRREKVQRQGRKPTGPTARSAARCARPSRNSAAPCPRSCRRPSRAFSRLRARRKSWQAGRGGRRNDLPF